MIVTFQQVLTWPRPTGLKPLCSLLALKTSEPTGPDPGVSYPPWNLSFSVDSVDKYLLSTCYK